MSSKIFLESEIGVQEKKYSLFHVIPVPYEKTVSYGSGTDQGPASILEASDNLELFDGYSSPAEEGIYTAPFIDCSSSEEDALQKIQAEVYNSAKSESIPVVLGGEHTISSAVAAGLKEHYGEIGVIQFDAHADLRDSYEDNKLSHACVMRRIYEQGIPIINIANRALSPEEVIYRSGKNIPFQDAQDIYKEDNFKISIPDDFPENIFITIDVDGFDPSIMPATGTPEPGGLLWYDFFKMIESIPKDKKIIGFDVVELAPIKNLHFCEFTAARLVYNMMGFIQRRKLSS